MACWTEDDGIHSCGHQHASVSDAMKCLPPGGAGFVRAFDAKNCRALNDAEWIDFMAALNTIPRHSPSSD